MTTYPTSTVPSAKSWLFSQLQSTLTAVSTNTFGLTYATSINTINGPDDQVWLGATRNRVVTNLAMVGNLGQYALKEEYDLTVMVSVFRQGESDESSDDPAIAAETRAWALAGQIETIGRTDPTFGGVLVTSIPFQSESDDIDWDEESNGRVCTLTVSFHCLAQL